MLIYTKRAAPKAPKRRSRAGCLNCKEKKKKCNEKRPQCDRCSERDLPCKYEPAKPRKRRRTSFTGSALSNQSPLFCSERWPGRFDNGKLLYDSQSLDAAIESWDLNTTYLYPGSDGSLEWEGGYGSENEVEEVIPTKSAPIVTSDPMAIVCSRSYNPDLAMIAPSPLASPLLEFTAPIFEEFTDRRSRRRLVDHFCNVLSHLIVFKEDTGNPFRQLVLPLSHGCSPVMNAMFALSSAHLEYRGIETPEKSLDFHNKALQGLAVLIDQNDASNREEILGAIMLLVYYEVLVQRGNSNIVNEHLKGAMTLMKTGPQVTTPTTLFLERAFRFYDVIAALSLGTSPHTNTPPVATPFPLPEPGSLSKPLNSVDTLLGLSTDLWPIIHRLSHLLSYKVSLDAALAAGQTSKAIVIRTELENTSQAIELALDNWTPTFETYADSPRSQSDDSEMGEADLPSLTEDSRLQSILNNAEAYRHSAFVYLYRIIRSHPRSHPVIQKHAHLSLRACANVVKQAERCHDGPMSALLWPLFVSSCEAITDEDRDLAARAFKGTEQRQGMNNIMRTWEVIQEVWSRSDLGEEDVDWRSICEQRGFSIVFG